MMMTVGGRSGSLSEILSYRFYDGGLQQSSTLAHSPFYKWYKTISSSWLRGIGALKTNQITSSNSDSVGNIFYLHRASYYSGQLHGSLTAYIWFRVNLWYLDTIYPVWRWCVLQKIYFYKSFPNFIGCWEYFAIGTFGHDHSCLQCCDTHVCFCYQTGSYVISNLALQHFASHKTLSNHTYPGER